MKNKYPENLMELLKALADDSRLAILRYLNEREYSVGELAKQVGLTEPTVSHHLARLRKVSLVNLRMAGNQRFYRINEKTLARFKQQIMTLEEFPPEQPPVEPSDNDWIYDLGWHEADEEILIRHTHNGQLLRLPRKRKKQLVILRWLATLFEEDRIYTEKDINSILKTVYETDYVTLRRDLVDMGYLRRERGGGKYWVTPSDENIE